MKLFIILLLFLKLSQSQDAFEQVVSDLSTLTRITNAIALQNAALQKTLKLDEVISELLRVEERIFQSLMSLNISRIQPQYQEIFGKIQGLDGTLQLKYKDLKKFDETMEFLQNLKDLEPSGNSFSAQELINLINASNHLQMPCNPQPLEHMAKFLGVITKEKIVGPYTEKIYQLNFRSATKDLLVCFEACKAYRAQGPFYEELKKLKVAFGLSKVLLDYNNHYGKLERLSGKLDKLISDVGKTAVLDNKDSEKFIGPLIQEARAQNARLGGPYLWVPSLTVGFRGLGDLFKVSQDLKNPWFTAKVARNKSTKHLKKGLAQFFEFTKSVAKIEAPWKELRNQTNLEALDQVRRFARYLDFLETFQTSVKSLNTLRASKTLFDKCWTNSKAEKVEKKVLNLIQRRYEVPAEVLEAIHNVQLQSENVAGAMKVAEFEELLWKVQGSIPARFEDSEVATNRRHILEIPGSRNLMEAFISLRKLLIAQTDYMRYFSYMKSNRPAFFNTSTFDLKTSIDDSKVMKLITCLKQKNFQANDTLKVTEFLEKIVRLGDKSRINWIGEFLERIKKVQVVLEDVRNAVKRKRTLRMRRQSQKPLENPILKLNDSQGLALHLAEGMQVLHQMVHARTHRTTLQGPISYPEYILSKIQDATRKELYSEFWRNPGEPINRTLKGLDSLNNISRTVNHKGLLELRKVFPQAMKVPGIKLYRDTFRKIPGILQDNLTDPETLEAYRNSRILGQWDLDFVIYKTKLDAAHLSIATLSSFFDDIFGLKPVIGTGKQVQNNITVVNNNEHISYWVVVGMCFGFFALCILLGFVGYGFTKNGRKKYRNLWLYYFPNKEEFERRWRYSLFMDRENGQNALIDASREINHINVRNILDQGAYINVYSPFGNTPLHMATKRGFPKVVEVLIKNGADRTLLNAQNKTAEQMIPLDYKKEFKKDEVVKYEQIEKIYEKNRNKTFRIRVPQVFPTHLFHIFIEKRTGDDVTNRFMDKYQGITSDEALPTTTHCVCKATDNGTLETDDVDILCWIFLGVIMVKDSWMTDCLEDEKVIKQDSKYLIEHVRYNGTLYENSVLPWSRAQAKGAMPYLYGVYVVFVMKECPKLPTLTLIITTLGGIFLEHFPTADTFNPGAHPYLHTNLGPAFIIHDNSTDLSHYKKNKMFTLFTEQEFIAFLLKREIQQDTNEKVITQLAGMDE